VIEERRAPVQSPRRTFGRAAVFFLLLLLALTVGGLYTATAIVVRVDTMILPGVDVALPMPLPEPVARIVPPLAATPVEGSPGTTRINLLVLGVDRRPHHDPKVDGPPNADSIHLLSLDPVTRTAAALAVPRDLYLEVPSPQKQGDFWEARINSTFRLGEEYKYPGGGPALTRATIQQAFHLQVDYYVVIDWVAFADVIDAMGGIDFTSPAELNNVEAFNPRTGHTFYVTIPGGPIHLDGVWALAYARHRGEDDDDFGRIRRQQQVMQVAAERALQLGWLAQGPQLYSRFRGAVDTDLPLAKLPGVLNLARLISMDRVTMVSLAGPHTEAVKRVITPWGEDVLVPLWDTMAPLVRAAIDDRALNAETATVSVVNATGLRGQDARAVAFLRRFALPPERISAATAPLTPPPAATTTITYTGAASETAHRVAEWLGVPGARVTRSDSAPEAPASVTITLGRDVRLPDDDRFLRYQPR
jgi:LCP family protein required for cell wall assembly